MGGNLIGSLRIVFLIYLSDQWLISGFIDNLVPVTLGKIVGGSVFVGMVYWFIYLRAE